MTRAAPSAGPWRAEGRCGALAAVLLAGAGPLVSCDRADPELDPYATVLKETAGLDGLPTAEALARLRRARAARDLPSLAAREARLVLESQGPAEALEVLDAAIERFPREAGLRWDRAALRARGGQLEAAAADLRGPLKRGELDPALLGRDPDLRALGGDPRFGALVRLPEVRLTATAQPDAIVGDRWALELAWRGRLVAAHQGRVGPWEVRAGGSSASTGMLPLEVSALGRTELGARTWPAELPVPSALVGDKPLPLAERHGAGLVLAAPAHLELEHPPDCVRLERRIGSRRDWHGAWCAAGGTGSWAIRDGTEVLLSGTISSAGAGGKPAE